MRKAARDLRELGRDTSGAIMVMGVFMAALLVGFLYFAIGSAEAILLRERMQDASDSGAFSAAIVHARGMNIIALLNMVMAAVLAVLVALKIVESLIILAIAIAAALSWCCGTGALIGPLNSARDTVHNIYEQAKPIVYTILRAGNKAATAVKVAVPIAAQGKVLDTVLGPYRPPAQMAFAWPVYRELPVEDGCFKDLCAKAGEYAGQLALLPLQALPGGSFIADKLGDAIGGMAGSFSGYFCGQSGTGDCAGTPQDPPSVTRETDAYFPETDAARDCREHPENTASCNTAAAEEDAVCLQRDPTTGQCTRRSDSPDSTTGDCTTPACALRAGEAATQCKGRAGAYNFEYQVCDLTVTLTKPPGPGPTDVPCQLNPPTRSSCQHVTTPMAPCSGPGWSPWGSGASTGTVCGQDPPEEAAIDLKCASLGRGETGDLPPYKVVTQIFACQSKEKVTVTMDEQLDVGAGGDSDMAPKRMKPGDEYQLGASGFQLKVVVIGDPSSASVKGEAGIKVATWGQTDDSDPYGELRQLGRISVAQAEYYFDCSSNSEACDRDEWLWHMYWRARLRRFRITAEDGSAADACAGQESGGCEAGGFLDTVIGPLGGLIVH